MQRREFTAIFIAAGMAGITAIVSPIEKLAHDLHDEETERKILLAMATFREESQAHFEEMEQRVYDEYDKQLRQMKEHIVGKVDQYLNLCNVELQALHETNVPEEIRETAKQIVRTA